MSFLSTITNNLQSVVESAQITKKENFLCLLLETHLSESTLHYNNIVHGQLEVLDR